MSKKRTKSTYTDSVVQHRAPLVPSFPSERASLFLNDCVVMIALTSLLCRRVFYENDDCIARMQGKGREKHTTHTYFLMLKFVHCVLYPFHKPVSSSSPERRVAPPRTQPHLLFLRA
ncbi:hypothetical protein OUZ56_028051 [Daphnia magna]|uniref:Uncharacterized protein n=1 Tax=Daphnia magna TaxID=35525 RepID=A0ABR0B2Q9_9CRUS|nr:hypothetical protein OUZ56_028051 [Daphnia magna]